MTTERGDELFTTDDGVELHVVHARPRSESRAHVLIVHGFAEHGGRYDALVESLARHGMTTHLVDLRGHGRSPGARAFVGDADRFVRDVILLLERLQPEPGALGLFGHSFGGAVAARAAQERPDLLDALVLSAPYLVPALQDPPWLLGAARLASYVAPRLRTRRIPAEVISSLEEERRRYREDPLVDHGGVRLASFREMRALGPRVLDDAERLVTPTLIVHGDGDGLAHPDGSRRLAAGVVEGPVTLRIVEGGRHELLHDVDADRVRTGIVEWLVDWLGLLPDPASTGEARANDQRST